MGYVGDVELDLGADLLAHAVEHRTPPEDRIRLYLASTSPARLALLRAAGVEPVVVPSQVDEPAAVEAAEREHGPLTAPDMVLLLARAKAEAVAAGRGAGGPGGPGGRAGGSGGLISAGGLDGRADGPRGLISAGGPGGRAGGPGGLISAGGLDGLILGGDSAFEIDGAVHGKPHTAEVARARWLAQRGRTGVLHSGHWLIDARRPGTGPAVGAVASASVTFAGDIADAEIDAYVATGEPLAVAGAFTIDSLGGPLIDRVDGDPSTVVGLSLPTLRRLLGRLGVTFPDLWNR